MMNARVINQWIWIANVTLAVAIFIFAAAFILIPSREAGAGEEVIEIPEGTPVQAAPPRPTIDRYAPIWRWCEPKAGTPDKTVNYPPLDTLISIQGLKENRKTPKKSCGFILLLRTRETKNVYVGDTVEGAKVTDVIGPDTVEFDYYGNKVILKMAHGEGLPKGTGLAGTKEPRRGKGKIDVPDFRAQNFTSAPDSADPNHWAIDAREKEFLLQNDAGILNQVDWHPYRDPSGAMSGMIIDKVEDTSIVAARGFKPGDIIRSVDGIPINSFEQAQQLMRDSKMRGKSSVAVELERGGRPVKMQFDVR